MKKSTRGFASMTDKKRHLEICSMGGKAAHKKGTAHEWTKEEAAAAGKIGGLIASENKKRKLS